MGSLMAGLMRMFGLSRNPHLSFLVDAGAIQLHEDKRAGHFLDQIKFDGNVLAQAAAFGGTRCNRDQGLS